VARSPRARTAFGWNAPSVAPAASSRAAIPSSVAAEGLGLHLAEPAQDHAPVEHRHLVVDDLRAGEQPGGAGRAQRRYGRERRAAGPGRQQRDDLGRHLAGAAAVPQLLAGVAGLGELHVPARAGLAGAVPHRDAVPSEPQVGGVEISGAQRLRRLRHRPVQFRQHEVVGHGELALDLQHGYSPARRSIAVW
jgi:hypothetical protein